MDISRMFHRFNLVASDKNLIRFFAVLKEDKGNVKLKHYKCSSLPFRLICSQFISTFIMQTHAREYQMDKETKNFINNNSYVDDIVVSSSNKNDLAEKAKKVIEVLDKASLYIHKYISNSQKAISKKRFLRRQQLVY